MGRSGGDADGCGKNGSLSSTLLGEHGSNSRCNRHPCVRTSPRKDECKLFATGAAGDVGISAGLFEDIREDLKASVADFVAVRIVDGFEVVKVRDDHRIGDLGRVQTPHVFVHRTPVGQAGQRVGAGREFSLGKVSNDAGSYTYGRRQGLKEFFLAIIKGRAHQLNDSDGLTVYADGRTRDDGVFVLNARASAEPHIRMVVQHIGLACCGAALDAIDGAGNGCTVIDGCDGAFIGVRDEELEYFFREGNPSSPMGGPAS